MRAQSKIVPIIIINFSRHFSYLCEKEILNLTYDAEICKGLTKLTKF